MTISDRWPRTTSGRAAATLADGGGGRNSCARSRQEAEAGGSRRNNHQELRHADAPLLLPLSHHCWPGHHGGGGSLPSC